MIRSELLIRLRAQEEAREGAVVLSEFGVLQGQARVDVAVINGDIRGFEIKSEKDTLERLPLQVNAYSKVFDFLTVVAGGKHVAIASRMVPVWWGIIEARSEERGLQLKTIRQPQRNPQTDPEAVVQLLWREEALRLLVEMGQAKGMRSKPKKLLWRKLAEKLEPDQLSQLVCECLRSRRGWRNSCSHPKLIENHRNMVAGANLDPSG